jgi:hypothetical protein
MFVQVIRGKTQDATGLRQAFESWKSELADGAEGWLGSTAGVADDGTFVAMVEFESAEAARRNSERPEQGEWWAHAEPLIDDAEFIDAEQTLQMMGGVDAGAGFVQVMMNRVNDPERAQVFFKEAEQHLPNARPDVTGMLAAVSGARVAQAVYFTNEAAAREGEASEPSEEDRAAMEAMAEVFTDTTYIDLRDPWIFRP